MTQYAWLQRGFFGDLEAQVAGEHLESLVEKFDEHLTAEEILADARRNDLRSAVRGMLTTTNVAIMKGDRYVPNIPTEALYLVLTDYAERRGIKVAVVLNPQFADVFD